MVVIGSNIAFGLSNHQKKNAKFGANFGKMGNSSSLGCWWCGLSVELVLGVLRVTRTIVAVTLVMQGTITDTY